MEVTLSNVTFSFNLQMSKFDVTPEAIYPVFIIGFLIYLFAVVCNIMILLLLLTQPSLQKPMFYIMFSLPLADLIGISTFLPKVLFDILTQTNFVYYPLCVFQGLLAHLYGGGVQLILAAMSIDRYLAICKPLHYNSIMTSYTVGRMIALAWGVDAALMFVLFGLQARLPKCKTLIINVFCDNMSLVHLSCDADISVNNIYGLFVMGFFQCVALSIQLFSYVNILKACIFHAEAKTKALNTCLAQFITFFLYEIFNFTGVISYRLQNLSPNVQKICGLLIFTVLPVLNPVLYGIKVRDIRKAFLMVLKKQKVFFK